MSTDSTEGETPGREYDWGVKDVATFLGCSDQTVRTYCKDGKLPHIRMARTYKFNSARIRQYVVDQETTSSLADSAPAI